MQFSPCCKVGLEDPSLPQRVRPPSDPRGRTSQPPWSLAITKPSSPSLFFLPSASLPPGFPLPVASVALLAFTSSTPDTWAHLAVCLLISTLLLLGVIQISPPAFASLTSPVFCLTQSSIPLPLEITYSYAVTPLGFPFVHLNIFVFILKSMLNSTFS